MVSGKNLYLLLEVCTCMQIRSWRGEHSIIKITIPGLVLPYVQRQSLRKYGKEKHGLAIFCRTELRYCGVHVKGVHHAK